MNKFLFSSDTHFYHGNVIKYSNRPFSCSDEMNRVLVSNWNSRVDPDDTVFHLGDFAFAKEDKIVEILESLNGKKILIRGNHDKHISKSRRARALLEGVYDYYELSVPDESAARGSQLIVMCHYPMLTWNKAHYGSIMLHGHSHGNLKYPFTGKIMDVGVDPNGYFPVTYEEVVERMRKITPEFLDHHSGDL